MAEDGLVLLDLCSSSFGSGHSEPLYKGRGKICWQDFWCLQWCQWETSLDCSMADLCFTSYWPKKAVSCSWPLQRKICWSCPCVKSLIFRAQGVPVRWDRPAHLVCLSSALPKGSSSGCRFQIIFLQDPMAPRCFCEDLLVSAVLHPFFFFALSNTWDGCICLRAVCGAVYSHSTLVVTCTAGFKVNRHL